HIATDCPNRKIITIIEEDNGPVFDEYKDDKYEQHSDQEEITYADCEEALVVRRSLSMVTEENESWLRYNIFHTRLKTEEHPKPYTLSWFKKGNEVKDGTTITLGPLDLRKEARNQFLSQAEFLTEAHKANSMFALILVEPNTSTYNIPHEVKSVLEEFKDVVSEELPPGLPPMRDIQHCIEFVPGVVIPHKAAYRMNLKEHEELQ
ncbi:hypothetical protein Tco_1519579, partial [Tanacetum coccineum]